MSRRQYSALVHQDGLFSDVVSSVKLQLTASWSVDDIVLSRSVDAAEEIDTALRVDRIQDIGCVRILGMRVA